VSVVISRWAGAGHRSVAEVVAAARQAEDEGFDTLWLPQTLTFDAMTALAVAAAAVPNVNLGTAVVPIQGRHPIPLAQQALTVADVAGPGRFTLGIGVTHAPVSEGFYGVPYRDVVELCREELDALDGLLGPDRRASVEGRHLTARGPVMVETTAPGLLLAALGPRMLELAGTRTDGTVTWMTGPRTLAEQVVPRIRDAAARAGRPAPRIVAGLPVCVTHDPAGARDRVRPRIEGAAQMASYKRQLAAERLDDVADLAVIGTADEVAAQIDGLGALGVTELMADVFGTEAEIEATTALLATLDLTP
jgi:5,10-methylenetetrahydromethanopterin reductase